MVYISGTQKEAKERENIRTRACTLECVYEYERTSEEKCQVLRRGDHRKINQMPGT